MSFQCFLRSNGDDSSDYDNDSTIDADYDPRKDQNHDDMDTDEEEPESDAHEVRQLAVGGGPPVGDQQLEIEGNPPVVGDDVHPSARFHKRTGKVLTRKRSCDPTVGSATFERNSGSLGNSTLIAGEMYRKQDQ